MTNARTPGTLTLTLDEAELLLEWAVKAIGRTRTKPDSAADRAHTKVWKAWSELSLGKTLDDDHQYTVD